MSAIEPCLYEEMEIESADGKKRTIDLRLGVIQFLYFEDVFSPTITAKMVIVVTDGVISAGDDPKKLESLYNNLPIRGGERVSIKIKGNTTNNKGLEFNRPDTYFYVSSVSNVIRDGQKELFVLNLVSKEAITNELTHVNRKFSKDVPIYSHVKQILKEDLKVDQDKWAGQIEITSNKLGFLGNLKKPFHLLVWLASKSVAGFGSTLAGFFFYQTKKGFHFQSVETLIKEGVKKRKYTYTHQAVTDRIEGDNDFNILKYSIRRNNDLLRKLIIGMYTSWITSFDPYNGTFSNFEDGKFSLDEVILKREIKSLGNMPEVPKILNDGNLNLGELPSRIMTVVKDVGTLDKEATTEYNSNADLYQRQSILRYNLLFQQVLYVVVPLNTEICVGDIIELKFAGNPEGKDYDRQQSGFYFVKELCHGFDTEASITSMTVIRDTFGDFSGGQNG